MNLNSKSLNMDIYIVNHASHDIHLSLNLFFNGIVHKNNGGGAATLKIPLLFVFLWKTQY